MSMPYAQPMFVFEVAQSIDLDQTERTIAGAERPPFRHRGRETALFQYRPAPLRVAQDGARLPIGKWHTDATVDVVLYDFGAAAVAYHVLADGGFDELRNLAEVLRDDNTLRLDARRRVEQLLASIAPAVSKPQVADFSEDYTVFGMHAAPESMSIAAMCDQNAATIAQILRAGDGQLSAEEIASANELRISFGPADVTIIDWDGAFVIDRDPEDIRAVLEFANVQLLEMRWLDLQMDDAIERSYQVVARGLGWRMFWPRSATEDVRQLAELQLESAVLLERVSNALKVFGEEYLARTYRLAARRFRLSELDATISRKLETIESIYQKLSDRAATVRLEALEWVVIALIATEIVLGLLR